MKNKIRTRVESVAIAKYRNMPKNALINHLLFNVGTSFTRAELEEMNVQTLLSLIARKEGMRFA